MVSHNSSPVVYLPGNSLHTWKLRGDYEQFLNCFSNETEPRETEKLFSHQLMLIVMLEIEKKSLPGCF